MLYLMGGIVSLLMDTRVCPFFSGASNSSVTRDSCGAAHDQIHLAVSMRVVKSVMSNDLDT